MARHKMTAFPMYWDESFRTWQYYGVPAQPAAALVDANGKLLAAWLGPFDLNEALKKL